MADDIYSVKINRSEGIAEITGGDKDWVSAQLDKVAGLLAAVPASSASRSTSSSPTPSTPVADNKPRTRRGSSDRAAKKPELEQKLTKEVKAKLQTYVDERSGNFRHQTSQLAIIATFLLDELGWDTVDEDDVYTVYVTMGWPLPGKPRSTMDNARARNGYFGPWSDGKLRLSHKGENFGRSIP